MPQLFSRAKIIFLRQPPKFRCIDTCFGSLLPEQVREASTSKDLYDEPLKELYDVLRAFLWPGLHRQHNSFVSVPRAIEKNGDTR